MTGTPVVANSGSGGGGGWVNNAAANWGRGAAGIVIIRYPV
jgi:hypothetical protein